MFLNGEIKVCYVFKGCFFGSVRFDVIIIYDDVIIIIIFIIVSIMLFDLLKRVGKCLLVLFGELVLDLFVKWFKFYISNIFDILKCSVENFFNSYVYCFY